MSDKRYQEEYLRRIHKVQDYIEQHTGNLKLMEVVKVKKVLLVIDMQNVCVGEKHAAYFKYDNEILIQAVNKVIEANKDNPVIYIKNIMKKNLINKFAPFQAYEGTEEVELVSGLHIVSDYIFTKYEGNAYY